MLNEKNKVNLIIMNGKENKFFLVWRNGSDN